MEFAVFVCFEYFIGALWFLIISKLQMNFKAEDVAQWQSAWLALSPWFDPQ